MNEVGLIGGTFDRFHEGHKSLIRAGISKCNKLEVWITNDEIARAKDPRIKRWEERRSEIEHFLGEETSRVEFHSLNDKHGPATDHISATAIVCTFETLAECEEINRIRIEKGLVGLEIICIERVLAWDGMPISSSRIRTGKIDRAGEAWIPNELESGISRLTSEVEDELKEPFGKLFPGPEAEPQIAMTDALEEIDANPASGPIIGVGDVTVLTLQEIGRIPEIAIIDGRTKRQEWAGSEEIDYSLFDSVLECSSPAGAISDSLLSACEDAVNHYMDKEARSLIVVEGEEDLSPLILHPLAPIGSAILYGQPGRGLVLRWCDEDSKERCRNLLRRFEKSTD